jgi:hypothetical protein
MTNPFFTPFSECTSYRLSSIHRSFKRPKREDSLGLPMKRKSVILLVIILEVLGWVSYYQVPKVNAVIWIGGHITSDTTWTPVDTYRVINDTYVDPGLTLTILPGVNVQFADGFSLIVRGNLNATGTDTDPIVFTSSRVAPNAGAWNTIDFNGNSSCTFALEHVRVEFAINGITVESQGSAIIARSELFNCSESGIMIKDISNLIIEENTIEHNNNGISTDSATHAGLLITGNTISYNAQNGIYLYSGQFDSLYNVTFSSNSVSFNGENGFHLYCNPIHNVTFAYNTISFNVQNGIYLHSPYRSIYDVNFSFNSVLSNKQNGIYLNIYMYDSSIHDVAFSSNTVLSNSQNGIYLYGRWPVSGGGYTYLPIFNVTLSSNTVSSNAQNGIFVCGGHQTSVAFDLTASENKVAANGQKGIYFMWYIRANVTENSVSFNQYGVFYESTTGNLANRNDIYSNTYGMNVTGGATVNAEYDYWGDSTGPYQTSLNPEGKGDQVNGNGVDLDFIPFLSSPQGHINQRPIATLSVDKNTVSINETVTIDATDSTDDGRIDYYFFDFGDGTNSSWTTLPEVLYQYRSVGTYHANLTVMDDYGMTSNNTSMQTIIVSTQVPEFLSFQIVPLFMLSALVAIILSKKYRSTRN